MELDIIVASLESSLHFWDEKIDSGQIPNGFSLEAAESLFDDLMCTYDKFVEMQNKINDDVEEEDLPKNVIKFPRIK